jgi:hypothetical protein
MLSRMQVLSTELFDSETSTHSDSIFWGLGCLAGLILFLAQVYWTQADKLKQNPELRIWLEKICYPPHCQLPLYKNLDDFETLHSEFQLHPNHYYVFQAVISNQAVFSQAYPTIKLNLLDFQGQQFAQRIFYPDDYLPTHSNTEMPAADSIEISMNIAVPTQKVGGYTFELL